MFRETMATSLALHGSRREHQRLLFGELDEFARTRDSSSTYHLHKKLMDDLQLPNDGVIHSLRHTFLTSFGEAGVNSFTLKKVARHSSGRFQKRYIHQTPEGQ
jgi:integrase